MKLEFEHNYQQKVMFQAFSEPTQISHPDDVQKWRSQWMSALSSWHSPYKVVIDCRQLTIADDHQEVKDALERMVKFFEGFFLRQAVGVGPQTKQGLEALPFELFSSEQEAAQAAGLREARAKGAPGDFRSAIQIQNHFRQHTVEVNFAHPVSLDSKDRLNDLKSKLSNNLMQWHSKWNLMIDCTNLIFDPKMHNDYQIAQKFFAGLFLKQVVGYSPKGPKESYPFQVFRSRHKAAALLEAEGNFSGDEADCKSRK